MPNEVAGGVVKVVELVGSSPKSFSDAVRSAVSTASQTVRNITGVDVLSSNAHGRKWRDQPVQGAGEDRLRGRRVMCRYLEGGSA